MERHWDAAAVEGCWTAPARNQLCIIFGSGGALSVGGALMQSTAQLVNRQVRKDGGAEGL